MKSTVYSSVDISAITEKPNVEQEGDSIRFTWGERENGQHPFELRCSQEQAVSLLQQLQKTLHVPA